MHFPAQCHFSSWAVNCQESNPGLQPNFHSPWPITQTLRWKNAIFICTWNHSVLQSGEVGYRAGVGGTQQSGYPVVHPRAHARSAPHGADSGEARQSPICGDAVLATPHTRSNGSNKLQQNTTTLSLLTPLFLASWLVESCVARWTALSLSTESHYSYWIFFSESPRQPHRGDHAGSADSGTGKSSDKWGDSLCRRMIWA